MKWLMGGVLLVTAGAGLPFLMVIRVLDLSLPLSVLAYAASLSGLLLGLVGAAHFLDVLHLDIGRLGSALQMLVDREACLEAIGVVLDEAICGVEETLR